MPSSSEKKTLSEPVWNILPTTCNLASDGLDVPIPNLSPTYTAPFIDNLFAPTVDDVAANPRPTLPDELEDKNSVRVLSNEFKKCKPLDT